MHNFEIKGLAPTSPLVSGLVRFSYEEADDISVQTQEFEILSRVSEIPTDPGKMPKMVPHPIGEKLPGYDNESGGRRLLQEIPIRFFSKTPEGNLSAKYEAYEVLTGRLACIGDGESAVRSTPANGRESTSCVGPDTCQFALQSSVGCKLHTRMKITIDGAEVPAFSVFEFQSSGINSYLTLVADLKFLFALFGDLRGLPLNLTSWQKSSQFSHFKTFYCAKIGFRGELDELTTWEAQKEFLAKRNIQASAQLNWEGVEAVNLELMQSKCSYGATETMVPIWTSSSNIKEQRQRATGTATQDLLESIVLKATDNKGANELSSLKQVQDEIPAPTHTDNSSVAVQPVMSPVQEKDPRPVQSISAAVVSLAVVKSSIPKVKKTEEGSSTARAEAVFV